jgi:large subunit ribosomal protein L10
VKTKVQKKSELKALEEKLPKAKITIFTTFAREGEKGLSVSQLQELKRALREMGSEYSTAKKTLLEIALKDLKYDGIDVYALQGSIGLVTGDSEPYGVAKKLYEFAKKNPALKVFGALVEGKFVGKEEVTLMATLPSREVLLSRMLGMMKFPLTALAMVLKQIGEKKPTVA